MPHKKIIAFLAPVTITAAEGESQEPAKFSVEAYTGDAMRLAGWDRPVVVDIEGIEFDDSITANLDHETKQRVGHVTSAAKHDGKVLLAGVASAASAARDEVVNSKDYPWQASIEADPLEITNVDKGKPLKANGREFTGPLYYVPKSNMYAFAFVTRGASRGTKATIAATAASTKENVMLKAEVKAWAETMYAGLMDLDDITPEQEAVIEANFKGQNKPKPTEKAKVVDIIAAARAEDERREGIANIVAQTIADNPQRDAEFIQRLETLADRAIEANWTIDKFDTEVLRATRPQAHTVSMRRQPSAVNGEMIQAAVCVAGGLKGVEEQFSDETLTASRKHFRDGIGLKQIICLAAQANGYRTDGFNVNLETLHAAFGRMPNGMPIRGEGFSTLSLPGLLSNTANKFLLEGWGGGEMTWADISDSVSVRDFKQISQYKLSGNLKYEKVGPGGEIKHGQITEGSYTNQAETYGKMFAITRTDIINDDLGALTTVPRELGFGGNESLNEVFWTLFLANDGGAFFHSSHSNLATGAFTLASLAAAEAVFMAQTKPNGTPLGRMPTTMLMPVGSYRAGLAAVMASTVVGTSGPTPDTNTFQGNYKVVRSAYLSNASFSGYSAAKWYLLAVQPGFSVIQTAFLNGQRAPTVETAAAEFDTLGIQMRAVHDFGVNWQEYRAGVQGSGA